MAEKVQKRAATSSMPGMGGGAAGEKSKDLAGAYKNLFIYLGKYRGMLIVASAFALAGSILNLIGPNKLSDVTDLITKGLTGGSIDLTRIMGICVLLAVLYGLGFIFNIIQGQLMAIVSQRLSKDMRTDISAKIDRIPLSYFDRTSTGDVLSRVTNDVDTVGQTMNQSFSSLVSSAAMLIGSALMMLITNWVMALSGIAAALAGFAIMMLIVNHSQKYYVDQQRELGALNGHVEETISGFQVVKVFNGEKGASKAMGEMNEKLYSCAWKSQFYSSLSMPMMTFIGNLAYVIVCVVGAVLAVKGAISFGTIVAFMLYLRLFPQPLQNISQAASSVQSMAAACERVFEFLDVPEMDDESGKTGAIGESADSGRGDVEFSHVRFGYNSDRVIIHDFNQCVSAGQKIAIVGPTGAGKTTLVNLLMRFYEVNSGSLALDGIDTKDVKRENVHDQFSMVLQDTWLFEGTLRENLVYNQEGIDDEDLDRVFAACGLTDLVRQLPDGYDTVLSDSVNLSQGQRQLITIARAMLKQAPLLILDEATSSVDTRTELQVQKAMDRLTEGKTSFVIAHRLSTIKNADCILVLKDGDIIESGTHEELLSKNGFYADLYNSQFEQAS